MLFASSWHDLNISDGAQAGFSPRGAAARPRPPVGAVLPSCRRAGAGLEPGIPAHAWDVQFPLGDISSSCSGYACWWVPLKVGCHVWGCTVCSCHFSVGLFLFPCWPVAENGPWAR